MQRPVSRHESKYSQAGGAVQAGNESFLEDWGGKIAAQESKIYILLY